MRYDVLALIASLERVTDEDSVSEMVSYGRSSSLFIIIKVICKGFLNICLVLYTRGKSFRKHYV